jgi:hypothetical protein
LRAPATTEIALTGITAKVLSGNGTYLVPSRPGPQPRAAALMVLLHTPVSLQEGQR